VNIVFTPKPSKSEGVKRDFRSWVSKRRFILITSVLSVVLITGIFIFLNYVLISTFDSGEIDSSPYQNISEITFSPSVI